eukprot:SAG11_NODE_32275_length_285_cov_0.500000_1_plen_29_part_10
MERLGDGEPSIEAALDQLNALVAAAGAAG